MTRLTELIIATRTDELHTSTFSHAGKFGFVLELGEYRRPLVSSGPDFESAQDAEDYVQRLIAACIATTA